MKKQNIVEKYKEWRDSFKIQRMLKRYWIKKNINKNLTNASNLTTKKIKAINLLLKVLKKIAKIMLYGCQKIKKFMVEEKYFYGRIIVFIGILIITYDINYLRRYIISLLLLSFIIVYKYLYLFMQKEEIQEKYGDFFCNHIYVNLLIRLPIFLITNRYVWLKWIQRLWIQISKIVRYISIKLKIKKYYRYIDEIMYYVIMVYLRIIVDKSYEITGKIKKRIIKKSIKEIIDWRLILLIINIILIQKILLIIGLNMMQILLIFIIIVNLYIVDTMMVYLYWYNRYIVETLYLVYYSGLAGKIKFIDNYILIQNNIKFIYRNAIFYNDIAGYTKFNLQNKWIYNYWLQAQTFEGYDYFNKYWINEELYYEDLVMGINIKNVNKLFYYINYILEIKSYLNYIDEILKINVEELEETNNLNKIEIYSTYYEYDLDFENIKKKMLENPEYIGGIKYDNNLLKRHVLTKIEIKKLYQRLKNVEGDIKKMEEIVSIIYNTIIECLKYINEIIKENGQEIIIKMNVLLEKDMTLYNGNPDYYNYGQQLRYNEIIYNNYKIDNNNYKIKLNFKTVTLGLKITNILSELKNQKNELYEYMQKLNKNRIENIFPLSSIFAFIFFFDIKFSGFIISKRPIKLGNDDDSTLIYDLIQTDNYKSYYMVERLELIKNLIKGIEKIKIDEKEIKKYKSYYGGVAVTLITYEQYLEQQTRIKILRNNIKNK